MLRGGRAPRRRRRTPSRPSSGYRRPAGPYGGAAPGVGGGSQETHATTPTRPKGTPTNVPSYRARTSAPSAAASVAATNFVDKHVSIDRFGVPSLLPSAVQGIAKAQREAGGTVKLPKTLKAP